MDERRDDFDDEEAGDASAMAFEDLRSEVAALRRSIDAFPAAVQDNCTSWHSI